MHKRFFTILTLLLFIEVQSFPAVAQDKQTYNYFTSFFHHKETVELLRPPGKPTINAYDPDSILTKCSINAWVTRKLNVITTGNEIENIRKNGIFTAIRDTSDFIIVSKNTIKDITYYRIFRPKTGADGHFGIKLENKLLIKLKAKYGWF
ncbi:MAG: hypothetical protein JNM21_11015 [Taibaiella sp.]|nr:hypothetical protein [Taibaiella sp.]